MASVGLVQQRAAFTVLVRDIVRPWVLRSRPARAVHGGRLRVIAPALLAIFAWGSPAGEGAAATLPEDLSVSVTVEGQKRELALRKYSIRAQDFRVRLWYRDAGYIVVSPPKAATYRGTVEGEPNTRICAVVKPLGGLTVYAQAGKTPIWKVVGKNIPGLQGLAVADEADAFVLHDTLTDEASGQLEMQAISGQPSGYLPPSSPIQRAQMALDVTNEHLLTKYAGDWSEALADLEFTVNRYDEFMVRDVKMSFELTEVVVRVDPFYDYEGGPLKQLADHWSKEHSKLNWDYVGGFITPKNWPHVDFGGVAYVPGKYFINYLFHENGHNLLASHNLYGQDCMGGTDNAHWAALNAERIISRRDQLRGQFPDIEASQYALPVHPYATPDLASTRVNEPVVIDVLANDWDSNEDAIFIHSFTQTTVPGGAVVRYEDRLCYVPPTDYVGKDLIVYTIEDATGLRNTDLVRIEVINEGIAALWQFESATGRNVSDASGHGHEGYLPKDYEFVRGVVGNAVKIPTGSSMTCDRRNILPAAPPDWVKPLSHSYPVEEQASNFFDPMDAGFTLVFWFNPSSLGDSEEPTILFSKANRADVGYSITADPNGIYFKVREWGGLYKMKTVSWKNPVEPGIWHHVAMVIDRRDDRIRAWVDGQQVAKMGTLAAGSFICEGRVDLKMGGSTEVTFDEVYIYTRALTQSEILVLFRQAAGRNVVRQ